MEFLRSDSGRRRYGPKRPRGEAEEVEAVGRRVGVRFGLNAGPPDACRCGLSGVEVRFRIGLRMAEISSDFEEDVGVTTVVDQ